MKILIGLFVLLSLNLYSQVEMNEEAQYSYVEKEAKSIRRNLWRSGHEDVHSEVQLMTYSDLDEYTDDLTNSEYEDSLSDDQIKDIYQCKERRGCEVFAVFTSSSYWGGYGSETYFILLYTFSQKHYQIRHVTYAE